MASIPIQITVLGRKYVYTMDESQRPHLEAAAAMINARAESIRRQDRSLTTERLAVAVALQVCFESTHGKLGVETVDNAMLDSMAKLNELCADALEELGINGGQDKPQQA